MFKKIAHYALDVLERNNRKLIIMDRDGLDPYLERYYLIYPDSVKRERKDILFNTFIHRFMKSDEPMFHNHPWYWYHTVVLKGGYWEHTPWGIYWRGVGHTRLVLGDKLKRNPLNKINWIPTDLHWIEIPKSGETWTLFSRGKTHGRSWGFVPELITGKWYQYEQYLESIRKNKNDLG